MIGTPSAAMPLTALYLQVRLVMATRTTVLMVRCVGPCLTSGVCSSYCLKDDDCANPTKNMLCSIQESDFDLLPEDAPDGEPEFYLAYGICIPG